jgi:ABC-2 type transport system permease protein
MPWPEALLVPPMIAVVGVACYCYGTFVASIVLGFPTIRWVALNVSYLALMTFCGVNVPRSYWPSWLQGITSVLPMSHGLSAIRSTLSGGTTGEVLPQLLAESAVGLGWVVLAGFCLDRMVRRGRQNGSIEFAA